TKVPDTFHTAFTLKLHLKDTNWGKSADLIFQGVINGTLTAFKSNLTATFKSPTTQTVTLGNHVYKVTLPSVLHPTGPWDAPTPVFATVAVTAKATTAVQH